MNDKKLKICEIFESISGEGLMQGIPATFIRFSGCNMDCDYCDTKYHKENFKTVGVEDILQNELIKNSKYFIITGGEPFVQHEDIFILIKKLSNIGKIEIETNGSNLYDNVKKLYKQVVPTRVLLTVDYKLEQKDDKYFQNFEKGLKLIKSKMSEYSINNNSLPICCIKTVLKNKKQLDKVYEFSKNYSHLQFIISPCYGMISPTEIAEYIVEKGYKNLRMQIQLHKYLWEVNARGK